MHVAMIVPLEASFAPERPPESSRLTAMNVEHRSQNTPKYQACWGAPSGTRAPTVIGDSNVKSVHVASWPDQLILDARVTWQSVGACRPRRRQGRLSGGSGG